MLGKNRDFFPPGDLCEKGPKEKLQLKGEVDCEPLANRVAAKPTALGGAPPSVFRQDNFIYLQIAGHFRYSTEWDPFTAEPSARPACLPCVSGSPVPAAPCSAVWSRAPIRPEARACLHSRGVDSPGLGGGPAGIRFLGVGVSRALLTPGSAVGDEGGGGLEEHAPQGPRTIWKEHRMKRSPFLPVSSSLAIFGPHHIFSLGFASVSAGGSRSGWNRAGWQPGIGSARTRGAGRSGSGTPACLLLLGAEHPRAPFFFSGLEDPGPPRPLQPNSRSISSLFPDGFCPGASIPREAAHFPLPPPRPSVFHESGWDAGAFGDPVPRVPPAVWAAPRKGWSQRVCG